MFIFKPEHTLILVKQSLLASVFLSQYRMLRFYVVSLSYLWSRRGSENFIFTTPLYIQRFENENIMILNSYRFQIIFTWKWTRL